jgi:hypothetical protein
MGGLFGGGGGGGGSTAAAEEQIKVQKEQIAKQDQQLATQETNLAKKTQAGMIARRGGGLRQLLSQERTDSELGVSSKLGGG